MNDAEPSLLLLGTKFEPAELYLNKFNFKVMSLLKNTYNKRTY